MEWRELPGKKASGIQALHAFTFDDATTWSNAFQWLSDTALRFKQVFSRNWRQ
jgi:hypothetical protein